MEQPWAKYKVQFKVQELHFESLKETYQNTRHQSKPVISCGDGCSFVPIEIKTGRLY